jgi:uncharacterized protein YggE
MRGSLSFAAPHAGPAASTDAAPTPTITTRGVGTATAAPDLLTVTLGVHTREHSAAAALHAYNTRMTALQDVLRAAGVAADDLRTGSMTVHPTVDTGGAWYEVSNTVTARLRDIAATGALGAFGVLDRVVEAAGDPIRVHQIRFSIDDGDLVHAEARTDAVRRAIAQATQIAEAAGVTLGPIRSITEQLGSQEAAVVVEVVHDIAR